MQSSIKRPIYLDHNATTPLDPKVLEIMLPYLQGKFGNPSSRSHSYGWEASMAVDRARSQVATLLGAEAKEIIFTSGATESTNLAVLGVAKHFVAQGCHIITSQVEHKASLLVCKEAERMGAEVTFLPVDHYGRVSPKDVEQACQPNTRLVSLIMANNEVGTINPTREIGALCRDRGLYFHLDAAQSAGKVPMKVKELKVDLASLSGHKIYGPKGVGALYVGRDPQVSLEPMMFGGDQEQSLRPGTLNVPGIVGLGAALELAGRSMEAEGARQRDLRDYLIGQVKRACPQVVLNGHPTERLCNNISFSFPGLSADMFAIGLSGLAVSSGSACSSGDAQPSHVLAAMGHSRDLAKATLRIGLGRFTTRDEVVLAGQKITEMIERNARMAIL